jgi:hypothetical protein
MCVDSLRDLISFSRQLVLDGLDLDVIEGQNQIVPPQLFSLWRKELPAAFIASEEAGRDNGQRPRRPGGDRGATPVMGQEADGAHVFAFH